MDSGKSDKRLCNAFGYRKIKKKSLFLAQSLEKIRNCESADELLGLEGEAASVYFSVFDELILQQKDDFYFRGRNKRPPLDNVNAMLSFGYSLLAGMCGSALETVGLDPMWDFFIRIDQVVCH